MTKYEFHVISPPEPAAGLHGFSERVTITLEYQEDCDALFVEMVRDTLSDYFGRAHVLTREELVASINKDIDAMPPYPGGDEPIE